MLERLCDDHGEVGRLTDLITDTITRLPDGGKLVMVTRNGVYTITKGSWANFLEVETEEPYPVKVFQSWGFTDDDNEMQFMIFARNSPIAVIHIPDITRMYTKVNGTAKEVKWRCS